MDHHHLPAARGVRRSIIEIVACVVTFMLAIEASAVPGAPQPPLAPGASTPMLPQPASPADEAMLHAGAAWSRGEGPRAIEIISLGLQQSPSDVRLLRIRAAYHRALGRLDAAEADIGRALQIDPQNPQLHSDRAEMWIDRGDLGSAEAALREAVRCAEDKQPYLTTLADLLTRRQDWPALSDVGTHMVHVNPGNAAAYGIRAFAALNRRQWNAAVLDLDRTLSIAPIDSLALQWRAFAHESLGDRQSAIRDYRRAVWFNPGNAVAYVGLVRNLWRLDRIIEASGATAERIRRWPTDPWTYNDQGLMLQQLGRIAQAIRQFDAALALAPHEAAIHENRGVCLANLGDFAAAAESFTLVIQHGGPGGLRFYNRGTAYHNLREYRLALEDFDRAIALEPSYVPAHHNRGEALRMLLRYTAAIDAYTRAINLDPRYAIAYGGRAQCLLESGLVDMAMADAQKAIDLGDRTARVFSVRGNVLVRQGRLGEGFADLKRAVKADRTDVSHLQALVDTYLKHGRESDALQAASSEAMWSSHPEVHLIHARLLYRRRWLRETIAACDRVLRYSPASHEALNLRANAQNSSSNYVAALVAINRAIELSPKSGPYYTTRAMIRLNQKKPKDALNDLHHAALLGAKDVDYHHALGSALQVTGELHAALKELHQAVKLDPKCAPAFEALAAIYFEQEHWRESLAAATRAVELQPTASRVLNRGAALIMLQRFQEALTDMDRAIRMDPNYWLAHSNRARILRDLRRYTESIAAYNRAIELKPDFADLLNDRGYVYLLNGQYELALADLSRAIEMEPKHRRYRVNRSDTFDKMKRYPEAITDISVAIEIEPANAGLYVHRSRLHIASGDLEAADQDAVRAKELGAMLPLDVEDALRRAKSER